jgi:hypothetical protein
VAEAAAAAVRAGTPQVTRSRNSDGKGGGTSFPSALALSLSSRSLLSLSSQLTLSLCVSPQDHTALLVAFMAASPLPAAQVGAEEIGVV